MKKQGIIKYAGLLLFAILSCTEEAPETQLSVSLDKADYRVGEAVTFHIQGEADNIVFYSGEKGHEYDMRDRFFSDNDLKIDIVTYTDFLTYVHPNMQCLVSTDFDGVYDLEHLQAATWVDISSALGFATTVKTNTASAKIQGICPDGWHVPAPAEYFTLCHYIDNETNDYLFYGERTGTSPNYYWPNCYSSSHNYSRNIDGTTPSGNTVNHPSNNQLGIKLSSRNGHWIAYADNGASSPGVGSANATSYAKDNSPGTAYHNNPDDADWHWNEFGFNAWPIGYVERKHNTTVAANAWVMNGTLNLWTSYGLGATNRAQVVKISCYESGVYTGVSGSDEAKTSYSVRCVKD